MMKPSQMFEPKLVRLKANPEKIRVSIRRCVWYEGTSGQQREVLWRVEISLRDPKLIPPDSADDIDLNPIVRMYADPQKAVDNALEVADARKWPGIDPEMEWAYPHPHLRALRATPRDCR